MRSLLLAFAVATLAGTALASPTSPTPAAAVNSCSLASRHAIIPPTNVESTCKHHLNTPQRFLKVSG